MTSDVPFAGRVVLVTGGAGGLGSAIADAFHSGGSVVVASSRRPEVAEELAERYGTLACVLDTTDVSTFRPRLEEIEAAVGPVEILVNNAGVNRPRTWTEVTEDDWDTIMDTNAKGPFFLAQLVADRLVQLGRAGSIVNVASQAGLVAIEDRAAYCSSKAAMVMLTKSLAIEVAARGITVNAVAPTFVETALTDSTLGDPERRQHVLDRIPAGRLALAEEVAAAVVFLAGPGARMVTGQVLAVDGGWTAW